MKIVLLQLCVYLRILLQRVSTSNLLLQDCIYFRNSAAAGFLLPRNFPSSDFLQNPSPVLNAQKCSLHSHLASFSSNGHQCPLDTQIACFLRSNGQICPLEPEKSDLCIDFCCNGHTCPLQMANALKSPLTDNHVRYNNAHCVFIELHQHLSYNTRTLVHKPAPDQLLEQTPDQTPKQLPDQILDQFPEQ